MPTYPLHCEHGNEEEYCGFCIQKKKGCVGQMRIGGGMHGGPDIPAPHTPIRPSDERK